MTRERFSTQQKLTSTDIQTLFAHGKRVGNKNVALLYKKQVVLEYVTGNFCNKLGITVRKSVVRKAAVRNRIKRLFREVFRRHKELFPTPCHYLFIVREAVPVPSYDLILDEVKKLVLQVK